MTITPEDFTALTGISFSGTQNSLPRDGSMPTTKTVEGLVDPWLANQMLGYRGREIPYSDLAYDLSLGLDLEDP